MNRPEDVVIVLAEDDPGHARLIEKNLRAVLTNPIVRLGNGQEAVDYLRREEQATQQHLLLLDLNMPVMDGYQVLSRLKADPRTELIPVIVLTTTDDPAEIRRCYDLGCNAYVVKSADYEQFTEAMRRLGLFLSIARMPQERSVSREIPGAPYRIGLAVSKPTGWSAP
ncbi:MAG: response regulator [Bryobacteraceae bacterium]|jgi:CheY-like chemotaxis protein